MRFVVVGLGSIGERHVRNLRTLGYEDIAVVRRAPRPPRTLDARDFTTYLTLQAALDTCPDAVIIANPTALHTPVALQAAEAGVHMLIESPLAASPEHLETLREKVAERGCVTLMGHNLRFHPCLRAMRDFVANGGIGRPLFARAEFGEYLPACHPWEDYRQGYAARRDLGGGVILTSIHEIDYLYWLLGPVQDVAAMTGHLSNLELDVEDSASIVMRHENGVISEVHLDFVQSTYSRSCKIVGTAGVVLWDFLENRVTAHTHATSSWRNILTLDKNFDFNRTYIDEMVHFIQCIQKKEESINTINEGIHILNIGISSNKSSSMMAFMRINDVEKAR